MPKLSIDRSSFENTDPVIGRQSRGGGNSGNDEVPAGRRTYEKQARRSKRSPSDRKFESG